MASYNAASSYLHAILQYRLWPDEVQFGLDRQHHIETCLAPSTLDNVILWSGLTAPSLLAPTLQPCLWPDWHIKLIQRLTAFTH